MVNKVVWLCWFQGWDDAPWLVRKCLASWQQRNPGWDIRALDARSVQRYIELPDLEGRVITHASMANIVRMKLLHEYGGVWADATLLCHTALDDWLPALRGEGFFAFDRPGPDRLLSTWFLAAEEGHHIVARLLTSMLAFWATRSSADHYFWTHRLFAHLCATDPEFRASWLRVPKVSADGPHTLQRVGLLEDRPSVVERALSDPPVVSKLTYRYDDARRSARSLVSRLLEDLAEPRLPPADRGVAGSLAQAPIASLSVSTQDLADHIQIIASRRLIQRVSDPPSVFLDRDDEVKSTPRLDASGAPVPIVLNGWFNNNRTEWPPRPPLDPVFVGFHIRSSQYVELLSPEAVRYYRAHEPIGCGDRYTRDALVVHGVDAFISRCLTLSIPRRPWTG